MRFTDRDTVIDDGSALVHGEHYHLTMGQRWKWCWDCGLRRVDPWQIGPDQHDCTQEDP